MLRPPRLRPIRAPAGENRAAGV